MKVGGISYSPAWRVFANNGMAVIMYATMRLDLGGLEKVPRTGPLLVIINHNSFVDPLVPCVFVRQDVFPMAKVEALNHWLGWTLKWYGAFPIRRGTGDVKSLKTALRVLRAGHALLMAPEGTRNPDGVLQDAHEGAALIAARSGAPILPIGMRGAAPYLKNLKRLKRTTVTMRVGHPLVLRPQDHNPTREELKEMTDEMMYALAALLPPAMRGRYSDVDTFAPRYLVSYDGTAPAVGAVPEVMPMTN
jgi:1-acyl-sn-glycerol-3-phosphate acyltransferase